MSTDAPADPLIIFKFMCNVVGCEYGTDNDVHLALHQRSHHRIQLPAHLQAISCGECSYFTENSRHLLRHKKSHSKGAAEIEKWNNGLRIGLHPNSEFSDFYFIKEVDGRYTCTVCDAKLNSKPAQHVRLNHRVPPICCHICTFHPITPNYSEAHQWFEHGVPLPIDKAYKTCPICAYIARGPACLEEHLKIHDKMVKRPLPRDDVAQNIERKAKRSKNDPSTSAGPVDPRNIHLTSSGSPPI